MVTPVPTPGTVSPTAPLEITSPPIGLSAPVSALGNMKHTCKELGAGELCVLALSAGNGRIGSAIVSYHKKSGATIRAKLGLLGHSAVGQGSARRTGWRTVKKGDSTGKQWKDVRVVGECSPVYGFEIWGELQVKGGSTYATEDLTFKC
ncbi:hypothetical protein OG585_07020 [Streptomyces sp. NBC_01340]|uniref:hypothetical protein n=1 Tax=unclassified Streptomyces TaxID=2593676 RepID=UPI002251B161|nr:MULTISPECIES: hypothetical protein [unclassified Streptomyces]MCX4452502.1 hypothetical protein [Streptomyces sp. NBC_01719]MCX4491862.1 hypothetical protein [Streptomyces sp. NBC_01728]MCX4593639.1 hypothetical protein [Streptomyces sp. NBC_01549]WSI37059.1 hypothetical protein OG585_07020 [Streptomyces sp. NBC_01340]